MVDQHLVNEKEHVHVIHKGDTRVPLAVTLKREKSNSVVDLTDLVVEFYMIDSNGTVKVARSDTGVAVDADPTTGKVTKTFLDADVDTAGDFFAYFVVTESGEDETFPVDTKRLVVQVQGD